MQPISGSYLAVLFSHTVDLTEFGFALLSGLGMTPGSEHVVNVRAISTAIIDMM